MINFLLIDFFQEKAQILIMDSETKKKATRKTPPKITPQNTHTTKLKFKKNPNRIQFMIKNKAHLISLIPHYQCLRKIQNMNDIHFQCLFPIKQNPDK